MAGKASSGRHPSETAAAIARRARILGPDRPARLSASSEAAATDAAAQLVELAQAEVVGVVDDHQPFSRAFLVQLFSDKHARFPICVANAWNTERDSNITESLLEGGSINGRDPEYRAILITGANEPRDLNGNVSFPYPTKTFEHCSL